MADIGCAYLIELSRWGIKSDGTDAVNTSKGINDALQYAFDQGYSEATLPKGIYLVDEKNPIEPQSFMAFNLNGATLKINPNGLPNYAIVLFQRNQKYCRITNGKIEGDRNAHDYTTVPGTHEWGHGIRISNTPLVGSNVKFLTIDNLEIYNCTGDGISLESLYGQISGYNFDGNFEAGGISLTDGTLVADDTRIRNTIKIDMNQANIAKWGYFGLYGSSYGGVGAGITSNLYDLVFYKKDDTFLSAKTNIQFFDEVEVPPGASYAKFIIHQNTVPPAGQSSITLKVVEFGKQLYIDKCNIHDCRRLGVSITGAKHVYITECKIHHIKGTAPQGAIDIEDMYEFNQYIYIDSNNFHDNTSYNIIAVAGRHISITNNAIRGGTLAINENVDKAVIHANDLRDMSGLIAGEVILSNNHFYGSRIILTQSSEEALVSNCLFHNSPLNISRTKAYCVQLDNCRFFNDIDYYSTFQGLGSTLFFSTEPQEISNCTIEGGGAKGSSLTWVSNSTKNGWLFNNVSFINTKHAQNIVTGLPPGNYSGCSFKNSGPISTINNPQAEYQLKNCTFEWDGYTQLTFDQNKKNALLHISGSSFASKESTAFLFRDVGGEVVFKQNTFSYNPTNAATMIDFWWPTFVAASFTMDGNIFKSTKAMKAINASDPKSASIEILFSNNVVKVATAEILEYQNHVKINNYIDGIVDPYYKLSSPPTSGNYRRGQIINNTSPASGGYIGWVVTVPGTAAGTAWSADTSYPLNAFVYANGNVYKSNAAGKSSKVPPSQTSGTSTDGSLVWEFVDALAQFKPFGLIS
ncbi:right-handed parallel beta-helix repeat-containing protein [Paenibacillus planticolens]|uniref:Right-handed parallel beta-helix repeat-containing protein n=1 Tax=Paenibacillus planticolens TaxID=2654976 RepID=A0ABX1ZKL9_9BACL|nr:right-handed parallel beta-helix repeat-containing protein [Paenibacillus planticolens]NOV00208.1 right-handed parallel beta-helix repeat-containing protein [Paenibacillus planticolens]